MARSKGAVAQRIYQLTVVLLDVEPPIWRRIQVPAATELPDLHLMLQAAMGWTNGHLYGFTIRGVHYSHPDPDFRDPAFKDDAGLRLDELCRRAGMSFEYIYDFGDCWEHIVRIEKSLPAESGVDYPRCLGGERRRPPEDIGGFLGYEEFLEVIKNPQHESHADYLEWFGDGFDPEMFDVDTVNSSLGNYKSLDMRHW